MLKIRITYADKNEKDAAIEKIKESFEILSISKEYAGRGDSLYSNIYLDVNVNTTTKTMRKIMRKDLFK